MFLLFQLPILPFKSIDNTNIIKAIDIKTDTIVINEISSKIFVLFFNQYSCADCFKKLEKVIRGCTKEVKYIVIAKCNNTSLDRRIMIKSIKEIINPQMIFFDIHNNSNSYLEPCTQGIFNKFKIIRTPAILLINEDSSIFYNYDNLFSKDSISINSIKEFYQ